MYHLSPSALNLGLGFFFWHNTHEFSSEASYSIEQFRALQLPDRPQLLGVSHLLSPAMRDCNLAGPGIGHSSTVWATAFSPDGSTMVSCSADTTLRLWDCKFANG
jgi:WD40 repeat protein